MCNATSDNPLSLPYTKHVRDGGEDVIRAISLDLWKTLILDHDQDEALRDRIRAQAIREVLGEHSVVVSEDGLYESLRHIDVLRRDVREMRDWTLTTSSQIGFVLTQALIHISEPTRLGMISYAVFCLKKKKI